MNFSLKNNLVEGLVEQDLVGFYMSPLIVEEIEDVDFNNEKNYIVIKFNTSFDKPLTFIGHFSDFKNWIQKNPIKEEFFKNYLKEFFSKEQSINEIVDDDGDIMGDDDKPNNSTNTMIGVDQTMDLDKIFSKSIPKSAINYTSNLGIGAIVW